MTSYNWKALVGRTSDGREVTLRRLQSEDLDASGRWINDHEARQLLRVDLPVSVEQERAWLEKAMAPLGANPEDIALAICLDGQHVGNCGLHDISSRHRHAEIGILIGEKDARGSGVGSVVYALLINFAFSELNLERLKADVYGHNVSSQKLHEKLGFEKVGLIPRWYFKDESYQDLITYHLSRDTWQKG